MDYLLKMPTSEMISESNFMSVSCPPFPKFSGCERVPVKVNRDMLSIIIMILFSSQSYSYIPDQMAL